MKLVCVRARHGMPVGTETEVPDGAAYSELYFAQDGTPEAEAARQRAAESAAEPPPTQPPAGGGDRPGDTQGAAAVAGPADSKDGE